MKLKIKARNALLEFSYKSEMFDVQIPGRLAIHMAARDAHNHLTETNTWERFQAMRFVINLNVRKPSGDNTEQYLGLCVLL